MAINIPLAAKTAEFHFNKSNTRFISNKFWPHENKIGNNGKEAGGLFVDLIVFGIGRSDAISKEDPNDTKNKVF